MAVNVFLKFEPDDGLKGEAKQEGFEGQIEVLSYAWGVRQTGGFSYGYGGAVAKANLQDMTITYRQCSASPSLMEYCASGKHIDLATLTCLKSGGKQEPYATLELEDIIISSYSLSAPKENEHPIESFAMNFVRVTQKYLAQDDSGLTVETGSGTWDQRTATNV